MGIAYSGSSAGSFVFPPISNYILSAYDLDGTFLILGGIMLNALIGTMFFMTPKMYKLARTQYSGKAKQSPIITVCKNQEKNAKMDEINTTEILKCGIMAFRINFSFLLKHIARHKPQVKQINYL